jgi:uncharacterized membrane-anchored protein YitT (DUF2179 family)
MKIEKKNFYKVFNIMLSAFLYALNYKIFVSNGNLFPSGFAGIARILSISASQFGNFYLPFGIVYWLLNGSVTFLVFKYIGKKFTFYSILQFSLSSIIILLLPNFVITHDILLIAVFGGIFNGIAISIALLNGGSSGGFDFIAIYTSSKYKFSTWDYIMYVNAIILILAGILFGWNVALYSIIYQFCTTEVIKNLHNRYKLNSLVIVTTKDVEVSQAIFQQCRHGITKMDAVGEYSETERQVLYMVCNNYQLNNILKAIRDVDNSAFISVSTVDKLVGNYYQVPLD